MNRLKSVAILFTSLAMCFIFLELVFRFAVYTSEERKLGFENLYSNISYHDPRKKNEKVKCSDTNYPLMTHPFYAFVKDPTHPCIQMPVNKQGFDGTEDLLIEKDDNYFDILITGGSVAVLVAIGDDTSQRKDNFLEKALNAKYESSQGKKFRVYNGAVEGNSQPFQTNVITDYASIYDGIVVLDGFNEMLHSKQFLMGAPQVGAYLATLKSAYVKSEKEYLFVLQKFFSQVWPLNSSYFFHWIYRRLAVLFDKADKMVKNNTNVWLYLNGYEVPQSWDKDRLYRYNSKKYGNYIKQNFAQAKSVGAEYAHFLQPNRWFFKELTAEEKNYEKYTDEKFFQMFIDEVQLLNSQGLPTYDLTKVFQNYKNTIYGDHIHPRYDKEVDESTGLRVIAEHIAEHIAQAWKLRPKNN